MAYNPSLQTNKSSNFTPFTLPLPNGGQLSGLHFLPPSSSGQPLLVALHGGTCTSQNYDPSPSTSASVPASALSIPFIAIDRPCYGSTTSFLPLSPKTSFFRETASWLHTQILPVLWREFGLPNNCSGLVTTAHSMAVPASIVAATLYAADAPEKRAYPLRGIIVSGFGTRFTPRDFRAKVTDVVTYPVEVKRELMLSAPELGLADPELVPLLDRQTVPMPVEELVDLGQWASYAGEYVPKVEVPVMYGLGEHDWLWEGTREHVDEVRAGFSGSKRVDAGMVLGAGHALEWGHVGRGWMVRCLGWAMEVCAEGKGKTAEG